MKQLLIIIAFFTVTCGFAQDQNDTIGGKKINTEWKDEIHRIFHRLNPSKVPHGLLLESSIAFQTKTNHTKIL